MTLPPRLPAPEFGPDPDAAPLIVARARRRRRTQARAALGVTLGATLSVVVGVAAFGGPGGPAGLQPVNPASRAPATTPAATAAPVTGRGTPAAATGAPAGGTLTSSPSGAVPPTAVPGVPTPRPSTRPTTTSANDATSRREDVANDPTRPCQRIVTMTFPGDPGTTGSVCLRYSWDDAVSYGGTATFAIELCSLDHDLTATWPDQPALGVAGGPYGWSLGGVRKHRETLAVTRCWRWTVRWNGVGQSGGGRRARFPRGRYQVIVDPPYADGEHITATRDEAPGQTTLQIV